MSVDKNAPEDKYNLVYIVFGWLGIGTLLPWNFFITVTAYWTYKFRTVNDTYDDLAGSSNNSISLDKNPIQTSWNSNMAMASMVPNVTVLLLNAAFGHRFKTTPRLLASLVLVILLFGFTCIMTQINTDEWQHEFLILTLVSVVFININSGVFQGGLLGLAGNFPAKYIGFVFSGQAIGGVFASLTNVIVIALGADPVSAAFFCFLVAVVFLGSAFVGFIVITKSDYYNYYLGEGKVIADDSGDNDDAMKAKFLEIDEGVAAVKPRSPNLVIVLQKISLYPLSVFLIFGVTLACFPAITGLVVSTGIQDGSLWSTDYFLPVGCFLLYNIGDYVGRFAAEFLQWPKPGRLGMVIVFVLTLARLAFIPLFLFCNANPSGRVMTSVVFDSDLAYLVFMSLFSISNGYLANICMMSAPQLGKGEESAMAANVMVACLGLGLGCGSLASYPLQKLL